MSGQVWTNTIDGRAVDPKAKKALKRLRTIAHALIRELRRTLPRYAMFECHEKDFLFYERVLNQHPKDNNKIYALHEPGVYCIGKGKDHKPYEYGNKVSIAATATSNIIVGVVSHPQNQHDKNPAWGAGALPKQPPQSRENQCLRPWLSWVKNSWRHVGKEFP